MERGLGLSSGYPDKVEAVNFLPSHLVQKGRSGRVRLVRLLSGERIKIKNLSLQKPTTGSTDHSKTFKARATRHVPIDILRALRK